MDGLFPLNNNNPVTGAINTIAGRVGSPGQYHVPQVSSMSLQLPPHASPDESQQQQQQEQQQQLAMYHAAQQCQAQAQAQARAAALFQQNQQQFQIATGLQHPQFGLPSVSASANGLSGAFHGGGGLDFLNSLSAIDAKNQMTHLGQLPMQGQLQQQQQQQHLTLLPQINQSSAAAALNSGGLVPTLGDFPGMTQQLLPQQLVPQFPQQPVLLSQLVAAQQRQRLGHLLQLAPVGGGEATTTAAAKRPKRKKKPADKPKRPLSAYNLFFRDERAKILASIPTPPGYKKKKKKSKKGGKNSEEDESADSGKGSTEDTEPTSSEGNANQLLVQFRRPAPHGKIGFENLAKIIGQRWQELSEKESERYKQLAEKEMVEYKKKIEVWLMKQEEPEREVQAQGKKHTKDRYNEDDEERLAVKRDMIEQEGSDDICRKGVKRINMSVEL